MRRRSDWADRPSDYLEHTRVDGPDESHFFMGCSQWTPARDPGSGPWTPRFEGDRCPSCGSEGTWVGFVPLLDGGAFGPCEMVWLPGRIAEGSPDVCGTCMRWGRDDRLVAAMAAEYYARGTVEPELKLLPIEDVT
jgi:hypothetical protein